MPRSFERAVRHPNREVVEGAVRQAGEQARRGADGSQVLVTPEPINIEVRGLNGESVERHTFMLGVDILGDSAARLKVNGQTRKYFRR